MPSIQQSTVPNSWMMDFGVLSPLVSTLRQIDAEQEVTEDSFTHLASAMTILDTEPMDGVDNRNGILGYITFVRLLIHIGLQSIQHVSICYMPPEIRPGLASMFTFFEAVNSIGIEFYLQSF